MGPARAPALFLSGVPMSSTFTKTDLINDLAVKLGFSGIGDDVAAEDIEFIDGRIDKIVADLNARKILYLADVAEIPADIFDALFTVIAMRMATTEPAPASREYAEGVLKAASAPTAAQSLLSTDPILRGGRGRFNGRLG
jgi:hypothetical protein